MGFKVWMAKDKVKSVVEHKRHARQGPLSCPLHLVNETLWSRVHQFPGHWTGHSKSSVALQHVCSHRT